MEVSKWRPAPADTAASRASSHNQSSMRMMTAATRTSGAASSFSKPKRRIRIRPAHSSGIQD